MKLIENTWDRFKYRHWTFTEASAYFLRGVARELNIAPTFFNNYYERKADKMFKKWQVSKEGDDSYIDIKGVKLIDICRDNFDDIFFIYYYFDDNYDKSIVDFVDAHTIEGPYCYKDGDFDVTVKKGDVIIDVGASVGEFCAYAAKKEAISYAFEPVEDRFQQLCKTAALNEGLIIPVKKGLGSAIEDVYISTGGISPSLVFEGGTDKEKISLTTLDKFVEENNLNKVDFIKADIEGAERDMLRGAKNVLKNFAPKLSICTYHYPEDPEILKQIILDANPQYKIVQLKSKLMAMVI